MIGYPLSPHPHIALSLRCPRLLCFSRHSSLQCQDCVFIPSLPSFPSALQSSLFPSSLPVCEVIFVKFGVRCILFCLHLCSMTEGVTSMAETGSLPRKGLICLCGSWRWCPDCAGLLFTLSLGSRNDHTSPLLSYHSPLNSTIGTSVLQSHPP